MARVPRERVVEAWQRHEAAGSTQPVKDVMNELGVSRATVHRHIEGLPRPTRETARALGVSTAAAARIAPHLGWRERATLSVPEAGAVLGIGRDASYAAAERGEIPALRIGRTLRVPVTRLRALLGETDVVDQTTFAEG